MHLKRLANIHKTIYALSKWAFKRSTGWLYRFMPKSMMGRSLLIIVTPVILLQITLSIYFYEKHWKTIANKLSRSLVGEINLLIKQKEALKSEQEWLAFVDSAKRTLFIRASFRQDELLSTPYEGQGVIGDNKLETVLKKNLGSINYPYQYNLRTFDNEIEIKIQLDDGVLRVLTHRKRLFSSTLYVFLIWMVGGAIIFLTISIVFMRNQIFPIRRLAKAAERFGKGLTVHRIKSSGSTEIRQATDAFNQMRDRIVKQIHQRTEMLAGVSHDLRTPLTRLSLQVELLQQNKQITQQEYDDFKEDLAEMEKMIEGYISFAKSETLEPSEHIDISALLNKIFKSYIKMGTVLSLNVEDDLFRPIKPNSFRRCIENLINNAVYYGKNVKIKAWKDVSNIYIQIEDDGPGIPEEDKQNVFKPFFRVDPSRSKDTGGVGLGLSISNDIIHGHGGSITLSDSELGGLCALIKLPL